MGNRSQEEALAYQRSRCWHAAQSIRSLSGLCMASHTEDRLGTAQLAQPNLGEHPNPHSESLNRSQKVDMHACYRLPLSARATSGSIRTLCIVVLAAALLFKLPVCCSKSCSLSICSHAVTLAGAVTAVLASTVLAMQAFARTSGASGKGSNLELAQSQPSLSGDLSAGVVVLQAVSHMECNRNDQPSFAEHHLSQPVPILCARYWQ